MEQYMNMDDAEFEKMQLEMLAKATHEQRVFIAASALVHNDVGTARHIVKHYSKEVDAITLTCLQQMIDEDDAEKARKH